MALTTTGRATQAFPLHPPADPSHFFPAVTGASDSTAVVPHAGFALVPVTNGQSGEMVVVRPEQLYVAQIEGSVKSRDKDGNVTVLLTAASVKGGKKAEVCSIELQFLSLFDRCKAILEEVVSLLFGQQLPENIQDIVEEILYYTILPPIAEGISIFRETRLKHRLSENDYAALCHMRADLTPLREVRDERQAANKRLLPSQTWVEASSFWGEHEHFAGGGRTLVELTAFLWRPEEGRRKEERVNMLLTNVRRVYASSVMIIVRLLLVPRAAVTYRMSDLVRKKFKAGPVIAYRKKDQNLTLEERVARAAKTIRDRILSFLAFSTVRHEAIALFKQMPREGQLKYANDFAFLCHLQQNNGALLAAVKAAETEKALALPRAGKAYAYAEHGLEVRALEAGELATLSYGGWKSLRPIYARALEDSLRAERIPAVVRNEQLVLSFLAASPKREVLALFRRAQALLHQEAPQTRTQSDAAVIASLGGRHHLVQKSRDEVRAAILEANPYRVWPLQIDAYWARDYERQQVVIKAERSNTFNRDSVRLDFYLINTFSCAQDAQEEARAVFAQAKAAAGLQGSDDFTATEQLNGGKNSCLNAAITASNAARREKGVERPFHISVRYGFGDERQLTVTLTAQSGKVKGWIEYAATLDRDDPRGDRLQGQAQALYAQAKKKAGFEALSDAETLSRFSDRSSIFWTLVEAANQAKLNQPVPHIPVFVHSKVLKENGVVSVELRSTKGHYYTGESIEIIDFRALYERAKEHLAFGNIPQAVFEAIASFNERSLNEEALFLFDRAKEADPRMARMTNYEALHLFRSDWKALQATFAKAQAAKKALLTKEQLAAILADVPQARDYDYGAVIDFHRQLTRTLKAQEALRLAAPAPLLLKGPVNGPVAPVNREEVQARVTQRFEEGGVAVELSASSADSRDRRWRQSIELTDLFEGYMGALQAAFTGTTQEARPALKTTHLVLSEIAALITGYLENPPTKVALEVFAVAKMEAGLAAKTDGEALAYFERHVDVLKRVASEFEAIKWSDIAPETHMLAEAGSRQDSGQVRVQFTLKVLERGALVRKKTHITIDFVDLFYLIQRAFPAALATAPERVMRTACSYLDVTAVPAGEEALSIFRVAKVTARQMHLHDFAALRFLGQNPRYFTEEVAERRESALWFVGPEKASDDSAEEVSTEAIQREELARLETQVADPNLPFGKYARAWEKIDSLRSTLKVPNQKPPGVTVPEAMPLTEEARQLEIARLEALAKDPMTPNVEAIKALRKLGRILWPLTLAAERALTRRIRELQAGVSEAVVPVSGTSARGGAAHMIAALGQPLSRIVPASGN